MTGSLFDDDAFAPIARDAGADAPLAERLRPTSLDDVVGLEEILGKGRFLRNAIESDRIPSMIFWGPPGSGKTTLARIIAKTTRARFVPFSATSTAIKDIRTLMEEARKEGYTKMVLDSHRTMTAAHHIYRTTGFRDVETPADFPEQLKPEVVFMECAL